MKYEQAFEKELQRIAPLVKSRYYKIPDTKMLNRQNRGRNREEKRPFDAVLATPYGNACVECKYGYNTLKPHQARNKQDIDSLNGSFFVLTKRQRKRKAVYICENSGDKQEFCNALEMLQYVAMRVKRNNFVK